MKHLYYNTKGDNTKGGNVEKNMSSEFQRASDFIASNKYYHGNM
jgi:hypothetical protein